MMNGEDVRAIVARTDAAVGLLLNVLVRTGVVTNSEMSLILQDAHQRLGDMDACNNQDSLFLVLSGMIDKEQSGCVLN